MRVEFDGKAIALDSSGETTFVSHAHFDHARVSKAKEVVATSATMELLAARKVKHKAAHRADMREYNVSFPSSGHVLGGVMFHAENATSFTYTGDFKSKDSLTMKGAQPVKTDVLLMESTFGRRDYVFPDQDDVRRSLAAWAAEKSEKGIAVVGAYSLGKAQEVIKTLNEYAGVTPLVNQTIADVCNVYNDHGVRLDVVSTESPEASALAKRGMVAVMPMHMVNSFMLKGLQDAYGLRAFGAVATGWALSSRFGNGIEGFCLSDHEDFPGLIEFALACEPKKVYCNHGYASELAAALRARGLDAEPLGEPQKASLSKWLE